MVATFRISLPTAGAGGELVVRHGDRGEVIDMNGQSLRNWHSPPSTPTVRTRRDRSATVTGCRWSTTSASCRAIPRRPATPPTIPPKQTRSPGIWPTGAMRVHRQACLVARARLHGGGLVLRHPEERRQCGRACGGGCDGARRLRIACRHRPYRGKRQRDVRGWRLRREPALAGSRHRGNGDRRPLRQPPLAGQLDWRRWFASAVRRDSPAPGGTAPNGGAGRGRTRRAAGRTKRPATKAWISSGAIGEPPW